jgi:hypothetical protein
VDFFFTHNGDIDLVRHRGVLIGGYDHGELAGDDRLVNSAIGCANHGLSRDGR